MGTTDGTMRALILDEQGLHLKTKAIPTAGSGEALVRVLAAGICRTDIYVAEGRLDAPMPLTLGHELAGHIEALGPDCLAVEIGTLVSADPRLAAQQLGVDRDGVFADYVVLPETKLISLDEGTPPWRAVFVEPVAACLAALSAGVEPPMSGLVLGDGRLAQLTKRLLNRHGILEVECSPSLRHVDEGTLDFIIETKIPQDGFLGATRALRPGGLIVLKSRPADRAAVDTRLLVQKEITLRGANYGPFATAAAHVDSNDVGLDDFRGSEYGLEQFDQAFAAAVADETRKVIFNVCRH